MAEQIERGEYETARAKPKGGKARNGTTTQLSKTLMSRDQVVRVVKAERTRGCVEGCHERKRLELSLRKKQVCGLSRQSMGGSNSRSTSHLYFDFSSLDWPVGTLLLYGAVEDY